MQTSILNKKKGEQVHCYHCGEDCKYETIEVEDKVFCCDGCKLVYELLSESNLCTYYSLNDAPGINLKAADKSKYEYLDDENVKRKLVQFSDVVQTHITFYIPKMHCSSCIWLLENLYKLNKGVVSSTVNFLKKEIFIVYNDKDLALSNVVSLLATIGYEPLISLNDLEKKVIKKWNKTRILKIGIAGFCFGNIMMLSFPEYFSLGNPSQQGNLKFFFRILNVSLSLPVIFYCSSEFFISAWKGLRQKFLNIDTPIAFAILVTFSRSIYEIGTATGSGYLDSMSGIVFFMLIGRYFQDFTYDSMSFERDYKSYFPISIAVKKDGKESSVSVEELKKGDLIIVRNNELIPADAILVSESTHVDYSFVTGESRPIRVIKGELVYAGGKQLHGAMEMRIAKEISQSYLTALWNKEKSDKKIESVSFVHKVSKYFTMALFSIALASLAFWTLNDDVVRGINALTTVLIVACPCALLLSATFTNGNIIRILGRAKFYVKNSLVIERLSEIDTIIFDKTGTITHGASIQFSGVKLSEDEQNKVLALAGNSAHPLSRKICDEFISTTKYNTTEFQEIVGQGLKGNVEGDYIIMGSEFFVTGKKSLDSNNASHVFVMINGNLKGYFNIDNIYRVGILELVKNLKKQFDIKLLSGDNDAEKEKLSEVFGNNNLYFNQKPEDKSTFTKSLQQPGRKVLMIGDGLNDTGALSFSDVGIAVSDNTNNFSPSCDAILQGNSFVKLNAIIEFVKKGRKIIFASFIFSILYNIVGLSFAVQGTLSPVIAAILMPLSSISIVLLTTISSNLISKKKLLA
jgi:Cu+-exporting ATPase